MGFIVNKFNLVLKSFDRSQRFILNFAHYLYSGETVTVTNDLCVCQIIIHDIANPKRSSVELILLYFMSLHPYLCIGNW